MSHDPVAEALIEAFHKVIARMRRDPKFAAKRARVVNSLTLQRPMRVWCLAVRAADRRIDDMRFYVEPRNAIQHREPHVVELNGQGVRWVTRPITIAYTGLRARDAAHALGMSDAMVMSWVRRGVLDVRYDFAATHNYQGKETPVVWADRPLDPNHLAGDAPSPMWGRLWMTLWSRVPADYAEAVVREPRLIVRRGVEQCTGWDWICPGTWQLVTDPAEEARLRAAAGLRASGARGANARHDRPMNGQANDGATPQAAEGLTLRIPVADAHVTETSADSRLREARLIDTRSQQVVAKAFDQSWKHYAVLARPTFGDERDHDSDAAAHWAAGTVTEIDGRLWLRRPCGKRVRRLYAEVPPWRIGDYLGEADLPIELKPRPRRPFGFACIQCVNWIGESGLWPTIAWNRFVQQTSGGLLTGRDVTRPPGVCTSVRNQRLGDDPATHQPRPRPHRKPRIAHQSQRPRQTKNRRTA